MDLNKLAIQMMDEANNKPISDFEGLSANEVEFLLSQPFTDNSPVKFKKDLKPETLNHSKKVIGKSR